MNTSDIRSALLASSAIMCMVASPVQAAAQTRQFAIEAQPAETAISQLGRQGDIQIIAARRLTHAVRTNAVRGEMVGREQCDVRFGDG